MCDTCSDVAVNILKMDFYSEMTTKRDQVLADDDMREAFGVAFDELIQGYASFVEKVFQGYYEPESIERRQEQWEESLTGLITQIEHGTSAQQEEEQEEPTKPHPLFIATQQKKNPFAGWITTTQQGDSPSGG